MNIVVLINNVILINIYTSSISSIVNYFGY